jgi:hypothetical protein
MNDASEISVVSMMRGYSFQELQELTDSIQCVDYKWEIGQVSTSTPVFNFMYLLGYPVQKPN